MRADRDRLAALPVQEAGSGGRVQEISGGAVEGEAHNLKDGWEEFSAAPEEGGEVCASLFLSQIQTHTHIHTRERVRLAT